MEDEVQDDEGHSPPHQRSLPGQDTEKESSTLEQPRKRRHLEDDEEGDLLTYRDAKHFLYTVLGQQACPLPPVRHQSVAAILMHKEEQDYSVLPLSTFTLESLDRHNRAMQGLDAEIPEDEVCCGKKRLAMVISDNETANKGVSMTRHKCRKLKMEFYYKVQSTDFQIARACTG